MRTKTLWIKDEYLGWILEGRKTVEVRVAYSNIARLEAGDQALLNDRYPCAIQRVAHYDSFEALLAGEDPSAIAPYLTREALLRELQTLYPPEKEALGVVALEIAPAARTTDFQ